MKKLLFFAIITLFTGKKLNSDMHCINDRLCCNRYQPICCTCPCERYQHSYDRGRCAQCLHFRAPQTNFIDQQEIQYE